MSFEFLGNLSGTQLRNDSTGTYHWGEERFTSVSSILDVISKPELPKWYAKVEYQRLNDLAMQLKSGKMRAPDFWKAISFPDKFVPAASEYRDYRAQIGTYVHDELVRLVLATHNNEPYECSCQVEEVQQIVEQYKKWDFDNVWEHDRHVKYLTVEAPVFHRGFNYAGTLDAIVEIDGKNYVLDYKTSSRIRDSHKWQLSAYFNAEVLGIPYNMREYPMLDFNLAGGLILHLTKDKVVEHWVPIEQIVAGYDLFKEAVLLHECMKNFQQYQYI